MNTLDAGASRKRVLSAKAAMQRLALRASLDGLQQAVRPGALLAQAASSPAAGSALLGVATLVLGGTRAGRLLRFAGVAFAVGKIVAASWSRAKARRS
jgi:hypothetical protein